VKPSHRAGRFNRRVSDGEDKTSLRPLDLARRGSYPGLLCGGDRQGARLL